MFELVRFNEKFSKVWDTLIQEAKNGLFFFQRNFLEYHKDRFIDHSVLIFKKAKLVAVLPAIEKDDSIFSHGGLTFGGLVMDFDLKASETLEIFGMIKTYYSSNGFKSLTYKQIPYIFSTYPTQEDSYALFRNNAQLIRRDISSVIQLHNKIQFSPTKKNLVNRNKDDAISVQKEVDFSEFWELLDVVLEKFDTKPVHTLSEIELLSGRFPDNIQLFTARREGKLIAGIVIFDFGNVVHTQYMANSDEGRKVGALDIINYELTTQIFSDRTYFSFGISNEDNGQYLNEGLIKQKELMGARGVAIDTYKIEL